MVNFTVYDEILQQERIAGQMEGEIKAKIKGKIMGEIMGEIMGREEVALEMLNDDLSVERVARLTKLSVDKIRTIDEARKYRQINPRTERSSGVG
jgi:predicted transposase YdaD